MTQSAANGGGAKIRPAEIEDVPGIAALIAADARRGGLLPRSPQSIRAAIADFIVAEHVDDGAIVACGALAPMSANLVELRSLAVDVRMRGSGLGRRMVEQLVANARLREFSQIYALTRAVEFFQKCGFEIAAIDPTQPIAASVVAAVPPAGRVRKPAQPRMRTPRGS